MPGIDLKKCKQLFSSASNNRKQRIIMNNTTNYSREFKGTSRLLLGMLAEKAITKQRSISQRALTQAALCKPCAVVGREFVPLGTYL
jgi:hypothetical protein